MIDFAYLSVYPLKNASNVSWKILPDHANSVKTMYSYQPGDYFLFMPTFYLESIYPPKKEVISLYYVENEDTAADVARRFLVQRREPSQTICLNIPFWENRTLSIGDLFSFENIEGIYVEPRLYMVLRISMDFSESQMIIEAVEFQTLAGQVCILGDRTTLPIYQNASSSEKSFMYLNNLKRLY